MGSLSLKTNSSNLVMGDIKATMLQKREGSSEIESSRVRMPPENESISNWQNIRIHGRKDDSASAHFQFDGIAQKEICSGFSKCIDFSLSGHGMENNVTGKKHAVKTDPSHSSRKQMVVEEADTSSQSEKGGEKVKEEPFMNSCSVGVPYGSGTSGDGKGGPFALQKDEKCIYSKIFVSKRRSVTKDEKDRAFQAARSFASNNPFFSVVMRPTHVYRAFYMSIPSSFVRAHLSNRIRDMNLETSGSRQWPVHCTFRKDYAGLRKGWSTFVWENNLEEGDACVFERIEGDIFTFRVHIFRVLEEIVPLSRSYMPYIPKIQRPTGRKRVQQFLELQNVSEEPESKPMRLDV